MKERIRLAWLAGIVALVYGNSLWNGFTRDDDLYVVSNPQVTHPSLGALFTPHAMSSVFRPLTFASYAMNWAVEGAWPMGYHLVNVLLQAAVACLLYLLLRKLLEGPLSDGPVSDGKAPQGEMVAFVAALLFAVHPIHTEAVSSVSGRPDLLAAGFLFAACLFHLEDREIPTLGCFVLALLSKESAVVFLPLVLVFDYVRGQWKSRMRYARMGGVTLAYLGVLWAVQGHRFGPPVIARLDNPLVGLSAHLRILNALNVAWRYVGLQLYPATLSCDYSFNQIPVWLDWRHTVPGVLAAVAVVAGWVWALRKRQVIPALAGGIYFAGFATTANILMPIGTIMGERLAYFSSAGLCLLVAAAWVWVLEYGGGYAGKQLAREQSNGAAEPSPARGSQQGLAYALLAVVLVAFGVRTMLRNLDWRNDLTLAISAVQAAPRSAKMHGFLGNAYVTTGQYDLAARELETALSIDPDYPDSLEALGLIELRWHNYQGAGWLLEKAFYTSDRKNMNYDSMAVNLAVIYMQTNHLDGALALLDREIAEAPKYGRAWSSRALLHYQLGQISAAEADAETALRLDAGNLQAQNIIRQLNSSAATPTSQR